MKKLVVVSVSFMAILALVTTVSADLKTYGPNDGWSIYQLGTDIFSKDLLNNPGENKIGFDSVSKPPTWYNPADDGTCWIGPDSNPNSPPGSYAYVISLGEYLASQIWELSGGLATDNYLEGIYIYGVDGLVKDITDIVPSGSTVLNQNVGEKSDGELWSFEELTSVNKYKLSDILVSEESYWLVLVIQNGGDVHSPQGIYSSLELKKAEEKTFSGVPEPATLLILGFGVVGAGFASRRRMSK